MWRKYITHCKKTEERKINCIRERITSLETKQASTGNAKPRRETTWLEWNPTWSNSLRPNIKLGALRPVCCNQDLSLKREKDKTESAERCTAGEETQQSERPTEGIPTQVDHKIHLTLHKGAEKSVKMEWNTNASPPWERWSRQEVLTMHYLTPFTKNWIFLEPESLY